MITASLTSKNGYTTMVINHDKQGQLFYQHIKDEFLSTNEVYMFNKMKFLYDVGFDEGRYHASTGECN